MAVERSNPILDTLGLTGLKKEGLYGFLVQLTFPLAYKISKGVREGTKPPNAITYPERALELGDVMVTLSTLLMVAANVPAAIALKVAYNLVANSAYEGLQMDQKIAVRRPKEKKVLELR